MRGGSGSPLADRQSITSDPESDDVTKYRIIAKSENELDEARFNDLNAGLKEEDVDLEHFDRNS